MMKGVNLRFTATSAASPVMRGVEGDLRRVQQGIQKTVGTFSTGTRGMQRGIQQLGFQVGDFAVQVAGGQSAILAFTQQGSQMMQFFGAGGAIVGAFLAVFGAVILAFTRGGKEAKATKTALDDLKSSVSALKSASENAFSENSKLTETYGKGAAEARKLLEIERQRDMILAKRAVSSAIDSTNAGFSDEAKKTIESVQQATGLLHTFGTEFSDIARYSSQQMSESLGLSSDSLSVILAKVESLKNISDPAEQAQAIKQIVDYTIQAAGGVENIKGSTAEWFDKMVEIANQASQIAHLQELNVARGQDLLTEYRAQADMARLIAQFGQESSVVKLAELRAAREIVAQQVQGLGLSKEQAAAIMRAWENANGFKGALIAGTIAANGLVVKVNQIAGAAANAGQRLWNMVTAMGAARNATLAAANAVPGMSMPSAAEGNINTSESAAQLAAWKKFNDKANEVTSGGGGSSAVNEMADDTKTQLEGLLDTLKKAQDQVKETFNSMTKVIADSMMASFKGLLKGTMSLGEAVRNILSSIIDKVIDLLMTPVFNKLAGGLAGGLLKGLGGLGASFEGGGTTGSGPRAGGVDGRGGYMAVVHPNETIVDERRGGRSGGVNITMHISTPDAQSFRASKRQIAQEFQTALSMS